MLALIATPASGEAKMDLFICSICSSCYDISLKCFCSLSTLKTQFSFADSKIIVDEIKLKCQFLIKASLPYCKTYTIVTSFLNENVCFGCLLPVLKKKLRKADRILKSRITLLQGTINIITNSSFRSKSNILIADDVTVFLFLLEKSWE